MNRSTTIDTLKTTPDISVLIIGAGINGIGTFRDLAIQGVDALIVDKGDFCSGASAASSHMVHGGIRYLENGEFRLVREAVQERNRLIENAAHYVKPLPTVIPIFKWFSGLLNAPFKFLGLLDKPSERGAVVIKVGMMVYDAFTRRQGTVPRHQFISREKTLKQFPKINPRVLFTGHYFDGSMHTPERICIDLLLDGLESNPKASAMNYLKVIGASGDSIILQDQISKSSFRVRPKVVINASGPWIDNTNNHMGNQTRFIGGTKGSHLVLDNPELRSAIGENEFFFENDDGRIVLIYPLKERVMIGTSDLPMDDPDQAYCTDEEIDYFINMVKIVFPTIPVNRDHIVFTFSGVRPLPASDADNPGQISRDHSIEQTPDLRKLSFPVYNLVGGKWTSFRAFSEEMVDLVLDYFKLTRKLDTSRLAIGGGRGYPRSDCDRENWVKEVSDHYSVATNRIRQLFTRYGTRGESFVEFIALGEDSPLETLPNFSRREVEYICKEEKVVHLDDFFLRRCMLAKLGLLSQSVIEEVAGIFGTVFNLSLEEIQEEVERTIRILKEKHRMRL